MIQMTGLEEIMLYVVIAMAFAIVIKILIEIQNIKPHIIIFAKSKHKLPPMHPFGRCDFGCVLCEHIKEKAI